MNNTKQSKVAKWSLIIAITILLNLFINVVLALFMVAPNYSDYCEDRYHKPMPVEVNDLEWERKINDETEYYNQCSELYQGEREVHERNVFVILIAVGVVILLVALIPGVNYVITTSFSLAAVLNFIIASMRYWSSADNLFRVIILGLALIILIWLGIKKFSDN